jgi:predicted nucleotidyltransferase component of viral defense system
MNLDKIQLGRIAKQHGFARDTLEKVIRLTEVLKFINKDEVLNSHLLLKGGTAINLTILELKRLSVDIDLDFTPNLLKNEMETQRAIINDRLNAYMRSNGYDLEERKSKYTHSLDSTVYSYMNTGGVKDIIKVEINYSIREHLLYPVRSAINTLDGVLDPLEVISVNPIEIYGSKLTALMERAAARDLYDVWNMIKISLFNDEEQHLLRKALVFYSVMNVDDEKDLFDLNQILTIDNKKIQRDLRPVIYTREQIDLNEMHQTVIEYIKRLIQLNDNEEQFIEAFYGGEYKPELLFEDEYQSEKLKNHPMMLWKIKNKYGSLHFKRLLKIDNQAI